MTADAAPTDDRFPFTFQHEASAKVIAEAPQHTTDYRLWCQLTSAFEGGSNYWIQGAGIVDEDKTDGKEGIYLQDWPFLGAAILIIVVEDPGKTKRPPHAKGIWRLDREALIQGAKVMASLELGKGGHHWHDVVQDNGDAITGDVFLQCCLFGEIVFG
jgi:hypothetical protein